MSKIDLTYEEMDAILDTHPGKTTKGVSGRVIKVVEESGWINDHKSQYMEKIIEVDDKFYEVCFDRQGSHWTDWHYGYDELREPFYDWTEVEKVEVIKHEWRAVK